MVSLEDVKGAARLIDGAVVRTPCLFSRTLSEITGAEIYVKFENHQFTGSFKDRGALVKLLGLDEKERSRGVIAMSAGNHGQGVAHHARRLGIDATIVMPIGTPQIKISQTEYFGAKVICFGDIVDESARHARELEAAHGLTFIHPFDDKCIIAGQGTVALEMLEQVPALDMLAVPVGGGGLIAGCSVVARAAHPALEVIGVESAQYASVQHALAGEAWQNGGQTIADGIAVKQPGEVTMAIIRENVADCLSVPESEIERAIGLYISIEKTVAEGAGAASLAGVLCHPERFKGRRVGVVLSGGNIDARILASILMRDLIRDGRIVRLRVELTDRPGTLAVITRIIGEQDGNILEVHHQRMFPDVPARLAEVDVVIEARDSGHVASIKQALGDGGYVVRELTAAFDSD